MSLQKMHHVAYRCRDAEETRHFYEDLLELPLVHFIQLDSVPSTGDPGPFAHLFFEIKDGSCIAFFDLGDGKAGTPDPTTPSWLNHLAVEVDSIEELEQFRDRLKSAGVDVVGPTDHGFVTSIYFFDPNGIRLEITTRTVPDENLEQFAAEAHQRLRDWTAHLKSARPGR